jgi:chemotaxis protein MotA
MLVLIGYLVAFGCIFGVYALHGNMSVLAKALPFEMATIGGGALAPSS